MNRWAALAVASLMVVVALAAVLLMSGGNSNGGGGEVDETSLTECEQAYENGLGNAATSERASWIADCEAELGG